MDDIITKRLHISGLTPAISVSDLQKRLSTFGEVKSLDGFGLLDGVGNPRKFGYVDIQTTKAKLARCLNLLSGSTWKGAKLRIGEAKPDYRERLAAERAEAEQTEQRPTKRRRVQGVEAQDMSLVTPENATTRPGWKVTQTGRVIRPMKMRPLRPLGPMIDEVSVKTKTPVLKKKKKERVADVRARRRVIDPLQWGSTQLGGVFLEAHGASVSAKPTTVDAQEPEESDLENDSDLEETKSTTLEKTPTPPLPTENDTTIPAPSSPIPTRSESPQHTDDPVDDDISGEKDRTLSLLNSLFAGDDWGGQESLSDVEEDKIRTVIVPDENDEIEEVPMDVIADVQVTPPMAAAPELPAETAPQKLKDLFAPKQDDGGFSLLGHLDLEMDFDEEVLFNLGAPPPNLPDTQPTAGIPAVDPPTAPTGQAFTFTPDPKAPLFFPLPSSFTSSNKAGIGGGGKQRDLFDVAREGGWHWHGFHKTETDAEIRQKWESEKGELTRTWKKRWREAGKARKRGGGGEED